MAVTIDGTLGVTTPTGTGDVSVGDDLIFTGTGNRITGDFSNVTVANRVIFQSSTTNGATILEAIPNGTSTTAFIGVSSSSSDPANASVGSILMSGSTSEFRIQSNIRGTGTYLPMTFFTGGSERVRIDTSGNVGIGTSSPGAVANKVLAINGSDTAIQFQQSGNSAATIYNSAGELRISTITAIPQVFYTNNAERMRIDSSGRLLIGTTSISYAFAGNSARWVGSAGGWMLSQDNTANINQIVFWNPNGQVGSINTSGSGTIYSTSSDYRLKENVQPMQNALATVAQLKPVTYTWKSDGSDGQGFIAHELQAVCPDAVTGEKDAVDEDGNPQYQGVDTSFLVATLTAAIQEQQAIIKSLQDRITALEQA